MSRASARRREVRGLDVKEVEYLEYLDRKGFIREMPEVRSEREGSRLVKSLMDWILTGKESDREAMDTLFPLPGNVHSERGV